MSAGWDNKPFNEDRPFGKGATVVGGDNIPFSAQRRQAIIAMRQGRATPEQVALVTDTDSMIQSALSEMKD